MTLALHRGFSPDSLNDKRLSLIFFVQDMLFLVSCPAGVLAQFFGVIFGTRNVRDPFFFLEKHHPRFLTSVP